MFVVELNLFHFGAAAPLGLVPQTILERQACILLTNEELYRFRVVKLGERIQSGAETKRARGAPSFPL